MGYVVVVVRMANGEWRMDQKIAVVATPDVIFRIQVI